MHVRVSRLADETNFHGNILVSLPVTALMLSMFYSADGVGNFISGKPKTSRNVLGNISRTLIVHGTVIVGHLRSTYAHALQPPISVFSPSFMWKIGPGGSSSKRD